MFHNFELRVQQEFRSGLDTRGVAHRLLRDLYREDCSFDEQEHILGFLLQAGFQKEAMMFVARVFAGRHAQHWAHFFELLGRNKIRGGNEVLNALLEGVQAQDCIEAGSRSYYSEGFDGIFRQHRRRARDGARSAWSERLGQLHERLHFARTQQLMDEERRILEELSVLQPQNPDVRAAIESFRQREADQVLYRQPDRGDDSWSPTEAAFKPTPQEKELLDLWLSSARAELERHPTQALSLAMMFWFFDSPSHVLDLLETAQRSVPADWLRLETLLRLRQYVDALDWLTELEHSYQSSPDTGLACAYGRALCYRGLGQPNQALSMLETILNAAPDYRMARTLATAWGRGPRP